MKRHVVFLLTSFLISAPLLAQESASAPQPAPAPAAAPQAAPAAQPSSTIPVISVGQKVKPEAAEKTEEDKPKTAAKKAAPKPIRIDNIVLESRQLVHSRVSRVGDPVLFVFAENAPNRGPVLIPKGSIVIGKIVEIENQKGDEAGRVKIELEVLHNGNGNPIPFYGTVEAKRSHKTDNYGNRREVFMTPGSRHTIAYSKKNTTRGWAKPQYTRAKGAVIASGEIGNGPAVIKVGDLRYPSKLELFIEPPAGLKAEDINETSIKLVKVNDMILPIPVPVLDEKIKVADFNKNTINELRVKFRGWDVLEYLPEGNSTLTFTGMTKNGKPFEALTTYRVEYR